MTLLSSSYCPYSVRCVSLKQSVTINSALLKGASMGPFFFAQCEITTKAAGGPNLAHVLCNVAEFYGWPVTEIIKCIQHQNEAAVHFKPVSSINLFSTTSLAHSKWPISRFCECFENSLTVTRCTATIHASCGSMDIQDVPYASEAAVSITLGQEFSI